MHEKSIKKIYHSDLSSGSEECRLDFACLGSSNLLDSSSPLNDWKKQRILSIQTSILGTLYLIKMYEFKIEFGLRAKMYNI